MKTIELKIYDFSELSEESKQAAINEIRESYYNDNDFAAWAIDDCSLLEPKHEELTKLFGKNYNFPLLENTRKIYFSLDRDKYIDISNGLIVTNENQFLTWLGIPEKMQENVYFAILKDSIQFEENDFNNEFNKIEQQILMEAQEKFKNHLNDVLNRIEKDIDYRFSDAAIIEDIECNSYEFYENGKMY